MLNKLNKSLWLLVVITFIIAVGININNFIFGGTPSVIETTISVIYVLSWILLILKIDFSERKVTRYAIFICWTCILIVSVIYILGNIFSHELSALLPALFVFFIPFVGLDFANNVFYITICLSIMMLVIGIYRNNTKNRTNN